MDTTYQYRGAKVNISQDIVTKEYFWGIQLNRLISSYGPFRESELAILSANSMIDFLKNKGGF